MVLPKTKKDRVWVLFDGSNFYHYLKGLGLRDFLNFQFRSFSKSLFKEGGLKRICYYVGAIRTEKGNEKSFSLFNQQRRLISHLNRQKVDVFLGDIIKNVGYHEKGVDVKIAVDILVGAYENLYDRLLLLSSDTDLLPAIDKATEMGKEIQYIGFSHNPSYGMIKRSKSSKLLSKEDLASFFRKE